MHSLVYLSVIVGVFVFFSCTLPGFLHVTKLQKIKGIPTICVGLGALFAVSLVLNGLNQLINGSKCNNPRCRCSNCKCGPNCKCVSCRCR